MRVDASFQRRDGEAEIHSKHVEERLSLSGGNMATRARNALEALSVGDVEPARALLLSLLSVPE